MRSQAIKTARGWLVLGPVSSFSAEQVAGLPVITVCVGKSSGNQSFNPVLRDGVAEIEAVDVTKLWKGRVKG